MSDIAIFIFGCGVMGVALAATLIAVIAGDGMKGSQSAASDRKPEDVVGSKRGVN